MHGRRNDLSILFLLGLDSIGLVLVYYLTITLRVTLNDLFNLRFSADSSYMLMPPLLFILPLALLGFSVVGLYGSSKGQTPLETSSKVIRGVTLGLMLILVSSFFLSRNLYSRSLIGMLWLVMILVLGTMRIFARTAATHLRQRGYWIQNVAIIGNVERAERIAERLHYPGSAFRVESIISPDSASRHVADCPTKLGSTQELERIINIHHIDRLLLSDDDLSESDIAEIARICERMEVKLDKTADLFGAAPKRIWVVNGLPLMSIVSVEFSGWNYIIKRLTDVAFSLLLLVILTPFLLLIVLSIFIDSPGPILFKQLRRGKGGRYFSMLKFRSMKHNAAEERESLSGRNETDGALFKIRHDPRITRVGRLLRRYSLDELPQLINVLLGEMSFVGPRPLPIEDIEPNLNDPKFQFWIEKRESVLPGITGLWQVRGRSALGFKEMLALDIYYIRNWSLFLDLQIVARTLPVVLLGKGAY